MLKYLLLLVFGLSEFALALPFIPGWMNFDVLDFQTTADTWRGGPGDPPETSIFGTIRITESGNQYKTSDVVVSKDRYECGFYFPASSTARLEKEFAQIPYETRYGGYRLNVLRVARTNQIVVVVTSEMLGTFILPEYSGDYGHTPRIIPAEPKPAKPSAPVAPTAAEPKPVKPEPAPRKTGFDDL